MLHIECKITGEVVRTDLYNWRNAVRHIRCMAYEFDPKITTKSSDIIQNIREGYEDEFLKAYIIPGDWRTKG